MIGYIKGEVSGIYDDRIILENNGIGYNISMPASSLELIEGIGSSIKVYTYLHVREDAMLLYGFLTKDELDLYKMLISVNGIGPKGGLALLSVMNADELKFAITSGDSKAIGKAPGVGPKTAQRVIIDLKDKIDIIPDYYREESSSHGDDTLTHNTVRDEAVMALTALGYSQSDSLRAVRAAGDADDVETLLKKALTVISTI